MRFSKALIAVGTTVSLLALSTGCSDDKDGASGDDPNLRGDGGVGGDGDGDGDGTGSGDGSGGTGGDGSGGGASLDPNAPADPGQLPAFAPNFPGAGTSGDDAPLTNGELCDYVPLNGLPTANEITTCFFGPNDPTPQATLEQVLECVDGTDVVHIRLTFHPGFVDNTYGVNAIGWPGKRGHTFEMLYKSDHAEIIMDDEDGNPIFQFKLDYISEDPTAESGYQSLGVSGGDGNVTLGDPAWLVDYSTSIDKNINERGYYTEYLTDSPATDEMWSVNPDAPDWDYRVVYEAWVDVTAFGDAGFGGARIEYVHASPAKTPNDTIEVTPGECPPELCVEIDGSCYGDPPGETPPPSDGMCEPTLEQDPDCSDGICEPDQPDVDCGVGEPPPGNGWCEAKIENDVDCADQVCPPTRPDDVDCADAVCSPTPNDVDCSDDICNPLQREDVDCDGGSTNPPPPPGDGVCNFLDDVDCVDDVCDPTRPDDVDCSDGVCGEDAPDIDCGTSYPPPSGDPIDCLDTPEDPLCMVD